MTDKTKEIESLVAKAASAGDSGDALRFSQAACNVANAVRCADPERIRAGHTMSTGQIDHMTDRFLTWRLPENFNPDNGISFDPVSNAGTPHERRREPVGTSLFDAVQAQAMVRHMIDGLPPG